MISGLINGQKFERMKAVKSFLFSAHFLIVFFFICPYLIFIHFFNLQWNVSITEVLWPLKNSLIQSLSASVIISLISIPMSLGLLGLRESIYKMLCRLLLIPQILPSLFSILIGLAILNPFPMGTVGIIFIFILVHLGYSVVYLSASAKNKLADYAQVGEIFDIQRWVFLKKIYFPLIKKDLIFNFFIIFIFCLSSFSIPLAVGAGKGTNLEVYIYEKIFIEQNYSEALFFSLLQSVFVLCFSYFLLKNKITYLKEFSFGKYLKSQIGLVLVGIYLTIYFGGYAVGLISSSGAAHGLSGFGSEVHQATFETLTMAFFYILLALFFLYFWIAYFVKYKANNFATHLISTSTVIVGFAFYLFFPSTKSFDFIKFTLAALIVFFPSLYKSFFQSQIESLTHQIQVAEIFGISRSKIIFTVVLRQLRSALVLWFSFLSICFLSDFAVSKSLGLQTSTLGLMTYDFLSSYRLSYAYVMSVYILFVWSLIICVFYYLIEGLNVIDKKLICTTK